MQVYEQQFCGFSVICCLLIMTVLLHCTIWYTFTKNETLSLPAGGKKWLMSLQSMCFGWDVASVKVSSALQCMTLVRQ